MTRMTPLVAMSLVVVGTVCFAEDHVDESVTLERRLYGEWRGPACGGDWTYSADRTFAVRNFSPGSNQLTGNWEVRWTTLPPTLMQTFLTSDDPDLVGQVWESRIVQLDDATLATHAPDQFPAGHVAHYTRLSAAEGLFSKLHGDWQGGDCVGELTFEADGTFERRHYSRKQSTRWHLGGELELAAAGGGSRVPIVGRPGSSRPDGAVPNRTTGRRSARLSACGRISGQLRPGGRVSAQNRAGARVAGAGLCCRLGCGSGKTGS